MFAVVEFYTYTESVNEVATLPLNWLTKNDTKCYWPITIGKKNFIDFVKSGTIHKSSWPTYKIKKIHIKTGNDSYLIIISLHFINTTISLLDSYSGGR